MPKSSVQQLGAIAENNQALAPVEDTTALANVLSSAGGFVEYDIDSTAAEDEIVFLPGFPLQLRANGKEGGFYLGEESLGNSLRMEIVRVRAFTAEIFNYPLQEWLEVFFIRDNALCHILFKGTETVRNFKGLALALRGKKQSFLSTVVVATSTERKGKDAAGRATTYYTFAFEAKGQDPARTEELRSWLRENEAGVYCQEIDDVVTRALNQHN